jgi:hypothetical protein
MERIFKLIKQPTYTPAGFDLTTHNSAGGDDTTRPRRNGMERHDYFLQIQFGAFFAPRYCEMQWSWRMPSMIEDASLDPHQSTGRNKYIKLVLLTYIKHKMHYNCAIVCYDNLSLNIILKMIYYKLTNVHLF